MRAGFWLSSILQGRTFLLVYPRFHYMSVWWDLRWIWQFPAAAFCRDTEGGIGGLISSWLELLYFLRTNIYILDSLVFWAMSVYIPEASLHGAAACEQRCSPDSLYCCFIYLTSITVLPYSLWSVPWTHQQWGRCEMLEYLIVWVNTVVLNQARKKWT